MNNDFTRTQLSLNIIISSSLTIGVPHQDIKTHNIFVCNDGINTSYKLGDFGLVALHLGDAFLSKQTTSSSSNEITKSRTLGTYL